MYPERLDNKYDKTTLRRKFVHAASRAQFEWCMNSARFRSTLPKTLESFLAVGTTRNENLHARLNAQYRQVVWISKRCLSAEIETWLTTEMAVCARAMRSKLTKKINRADILGYVLKSLHAFTKAKFRSFIQEEEVARCRWVRAPFARTE